MAFERSQGTPAPGLRALPESAALLGLALWIGFAVIAASVYGPAFTGPFISDDYGYIVAHPHVQELSAESVQAMFDPWGPAKLYTGSYAPLHLLLTAVERSFFGDRTLGYHLVNVALHALVAVLLVAWFWQLGLGGPLSLLGGAIFLLHPANVEAVAWASQLGTLLATSLSLCALLLLLRAPALATLCFLLALLSQMSALFALPAAAALLWGGGAGVHTRQSGWLAGWLGLALAYAAPMLAAAAHLPAMDVPAFDDVFVRAGSALAVFARYLVMAATSSGISAWHEPAPVRDPHDPWMLGGALALVALLWRTAWLLRAREREAVAWLAGLAAFLPASPLFPFTAPMADRFLYAMLPGLLAGSLFGSRALAARLAVDLPRLAPLTVALGLALLFVFAWRSTERVVLWQDESELLLDAALQYPEGLTASFVRARRAAQDGEPDRAVAELRRSTRNGVNRFMALETDPGLAPLREEPEFRALVRELAGRYIARAKRRGSATQPELRVLGTAHMMREEYAEAVRAFEAALELEGPLDALLRQELENARLRLGTEISLRGARSSAP